MSLQRAQRGDVVLDPGRRLRVHHRDESRVRARRAARRAAVAGRARAPHGASTRTTSAPHRRATSHIRSPNTPLTPTITVSPGSSRLTKHASMPAEPVPEIGSVSAFFGLEDGAQAVAGLVEDREEVRVEVAEQRASERGGDLGIRVRRSGARAAAGQLSGIARIVRDGPFLGRATVGATRSAGAPQRFGNSDRRGGDRTPDAGEVLDGRVGTVRRRPSPGRAARPRARRGSRPHPGSPGRGARPRRRARPGPPRGAARAAMRATGSTGGAPRRCTSRPPRPRPRRRRSGGGRRSHTRPRGCRRRPAAAAHRRTRGAPRKGQRRNRRSG